MINETFSVKLGHLRTKWPYITVPESEKKAPWVDGWIDDLRFYVLFNSISVISGRCKVDNEKFCAMEHRLRLRRFCLEQGSNSGPEDQ